MQSVTLQGPTGPFRCTAQQARTTYAQYPPVDGEAVPTGDDGAGEAKTIEQMTVPELREHLDARGIAYAGDDLKARLVELANNPADAEK